MNLNQRRILFGSLFVGSFFVSLVLFLLQQPILKPIVLYFPAAGSLSIESEVHSVPQVQTLNDQVRSSVISLVSGPLSMKYRRTVPAETQIRSIFFEGTRVWIDLSASVQAPDPDCPLPPLDRLNLVKRAIHFNFSQISKVEILVEGQVPGSVPALPARKS